MISGLKRKAGIGLALCLLVGYAALAAAPAQARSVTTASSASPASSASTVSPAKAMALPAGAKVLGPDHATTRLSITVALRSRNPAGLARLAQQVSTPHNPAYHHFLHPAQVTARFGAPRAARLAVRAWLRSRGLRVGATLADGLLIPAAASASVLESAFRTPIVRVRLASGRVAHANRRAATLPARLRPWVTAVVGLSNVVLAHSSLTTPARSARTARPASRAWHGRPAHAIAETATTSAGPQACPAVRRTRGAFTASQLAYAYQFRGLYRQGYLGGGITIALFEQGNYANSDIAAYARCYGIRPWVRRVKVKGGTTIAASPDGNGEATGDIETLIGLAPRAHVLVYIAPATGGLATTLTNYATIVSQDRAQVVSSSYGYCEPITVQGHLNVARIEAPIFQEMAAQGQSMLAASGDAGSETCLQQLPPPTARPSQLANPGYYQLAVLDPAAQPYVTAVGGTSITRLASPPAQTTWNQSGRHYNGTGWLAPFDGAGGRPRGYPGNWVGSGGISMFWPMPSWQQGFDTSGNSSGRPCGAAGGSYCRELPDVSALAACCASGLRGYAVYGTAAGFQVKGWQPIGGTSLATPLWAALAALADQQVAGHRLGLLSPALYQADRQDPSAFTDVTRGNTNYLAAGGHPSNFTCSYDGVGQQPCYEATPGYDMATGLGTPVARQLAADLAAFR